MTELELYRFINENEPSADWRDEQLFIWIPYYLLEDFIQLINPKYEFEPEAILQKGSVCIDLIPVCHYYDIDPENILKKES